jgi:hypothetical protein
LIWCVSDRLRDALARGGTWSVENLKKMRSNRQLRRAHAAGIWNDSCPFKIFFLSRIWSGVISWYDPFLHVSTRTYRFPTQPTLYKNGKIWRPKMARFVGTKRVLLQFSTDVERERMVARRGNCSRVSSNDIWSLPVAAKGPLML